MRRHGLLAGRQKPRGKHPFGERDMRPLDDSADRHRERLAAVLAVVDARPSALAF